MAEGPFYLGIDLGSTASKCVIVDAGGAIVGRGLAGSGAGTAGPKTSVDAALVDAGIAMDDVAASCATGYGRNLMEWTDGQMSELSCHAKGAAKLFPGVRTVIDIGGQDAKVLSISPSGDLENFAMNDKCAAGTGRFLEVMADRLGVSQGELSALARTGEPTKISSMCTVFAESEVISLVGRGEPRENIASGVVESVAGRVATHVASAGGAAPYYLTGGLCDNGYVVERLAALLGAPVTTCPEARYAGALGAALAALDMG